MKMGKIGPEEQAFKDKLYKEMKQEIKDRWEGHSGIYALVRTDKDYETDPSAILYIGKSTNFVERWISHKTNALCPQARENWFTMYERMRETREAKIPMSFVVLEECGLGCLDDRECFYLRKYKPPFNYRLPSFDSNDIWYKRTQLHVVE